MRLMLKNENETTQRDGWDMYSVVCFCRLFKLTFGRDIWFYIVVVIVWYIVSDFNILIVLTLCHVWGFTDSNLNPKLANKICGSKFPFTILLWTVYFKNGSTSDPNLNPNVFKICKYLNNWSDTQSVWKIFNTDYQIMRS